MQKQEPYDIIIIGTGAAGLMAAWELVQAGKTVILIEARDRPGGRIHTINDSRFAMPVELGAEFVHGNLKLTRLLLNKAGVPSYEVTGSIWRKQGHGLEKESDFIQDYSLIKRRLNNLEQDIPVAQFLDQYLSAPKEEKIKRSLRSYVEGYYAADTNRASSFALRDELQQNDDTQYRVEGGYIQLVQFLIGELKKKNTPFLFSHPVERINWKAGAVQVETLSGILYSQKLLLTVPLGVLQSGQLQFLPGLPEKLKAARALGFGPAIKVTLQFKESFWSRKEYTPSKDLSDLMFLFSTEKIPTWWTQHPKKLPIIVGWLAGPHAKKFMDASEEEILHKALVSLNRIFSVNTPILQKSLDAWQISNWAKDPYCCGGYSFEVVGGREKKKILKSPVEKTIYFAGEALYEGPEIGTVEAALSVGQETAQQIIAGF